ncbi:MAG: ubiquinol-cytochrome c reductase iron-sulfur subunit [Pirellulales bacterium]|nr:ubiquinol-cytochrome c reductase iron-sulfur subunit [Pirellulales bacterium]
MCREGSQLRQNAPSEGAQLTGIDCCRRGVLRTMFGSALGLGFTALGVASGLWTAAAARFMVPNVVTEPPHRSKVGFPGDYPPGYVETRYKERYGVWVVHGEYQGRQQIYALRTTCTHLGCITLWQQSEQKFKCPCHGSGFSKAGVNLEGPAPRPLERYAIRIADDGQLEIDRSRIFQEELGQWTDPACYVSV